MIQEKYKFVIQTSNQGNLSIPLAEGQALFVLGANGVGKSTLMHNLYVQNINHAKRILAHRQTWFSSNSMDMTAASKKNYEQNIRGWDQNIQSRWHDAHSQTRSSLSIFDLINSQNVRARKIADAIDLRNVPEAQKLSNIQAPLQAINELLSISNLPIIITLGKDEQLFASKNSSLPYSIAELSDGERNALLICSDVLTTVPNSLIILDEPERHLHRSIISPLLSSLFQKRKDCVFVISTHDVYLPMDHAQANILLIRGCEWHGANIKNWDVDLISEGDEIPDFIKKDILGSKRNILFVEGEYNSLDRQIYQLIFPDITVIPQGSCSQVEKAVDGTRSTNKLHWLNASGLIDADDRTSEQIEVLYNKGIAALDCYSLESLYYNLEIVKKIARRCADMTGVSEVELYNNAISGVVSSIQPHKERLCSRLCEKQVRDKAMSKLPKHKDILKREDFNFNLDLNSILAQEEKVFDKLIADNDLKGLINRYPVRDTPALSKIATSLGLSREKYESAVRKLVIDDAETRQFYKNLLSPLTRLINKEI